MNGRPGDTLGLADRGFQYGDGIFTTAAVEDGRVLLLSQHLDRLRRDARQLGLPAPAPQFGAEAESLARGVSCGVLKLIWTGGQGGRGYGRPETVEGARVCMLHPAPTHPSAYWREGVTVARSQHVLPEDMAAAGCKHMSRLTQVLARSALPAGVQEGLLRNRAGNWVEATASNLFLRKGGRVFTPRLDRYGVRGIMRDKLCRLMAEAGIDLVMPDAITQAALDDADEVWLTNSIIGLWPVRSIDGKDYANHEFAHAWQRKLQERGDVIHWI